MYSHLVVQSDFQKFCDPRSPVEMIVSGFGFTEGPIWHPIKQRLLFSDVEDSVQYWVDPKIGQSSLTIFRTPSNQANGNALDNMGRVISCEHASSAVVRHDHNGKIINVLADKFKGKTLNSPNDVIVDSKGRIWFTDPIFGRIREKLGVLREQELTFQGVYCIVGDELKLISSKMQQPNGLCLSRDERQLYVNDSWDPSIHCFDLDAKGNVLSEKRWAEISGEGEGVPDGLKMDATGRILCSGPGGIHVLSPDKTLLGIIRVPETVSNFCFGGIDGTTLFITARKSVYRVDTKSRKPSMKVTDFENFTSNYVGQQRPLGGLSKDE